MPIDKVLVTILSLGLSIFTMWFFLMKNVKPIKAGKEIIITVDGGYTPESIEIAKGQTTRLIFTRKDPSSCLEEVVLGDFKVRKFLPVNQSVSVDLTPQKVGQFVFSCGMNMFHGKIKVI